MARTSAIQNKMMLLVLIPLVLWIGAFELLPIIRMIFMSFQDDAGQGFTLGQYVESFASPLYRQSIVNSIKISFFSSGVAMLIAIICAYSITRFTTKLRDRMLMISNMITNFVGVPLAFAYMILLGGNGAFMVMARELGWDLLAGFDLYSGSGLLLTYIYYQTPLSILLVYPIYYAIRSEWKEAASLLGASTWNFWRYIGLPVMLPGLLGTFSILMANSLGAYATAYALTGINYNLLTIRIAALVSGDIFPNFQLGSALAVILAVIMLISLFINEQMSRWSRRRGL
ncbi:ABC transporter permease [Paenibacillus darwinianus]|uniref:ABC transporter permease n=1 Tax=Paenibacillus darwinianus TaxID=1380763 RepID=UPI000452C245|nr:ABC transporter permease subunit [Paenibacillus darwinianus]EXX84963.1 ABC transporter permease [Paenibacillus darwinianus]